MTRWARLNQTHKNKAEEATSWNDMKKDLEKNSNLKPLKTGSNVKKLKNKKLSSKQSKKKNLSKKDARDVGDKQATPDKPVSELDERNPVENVEKKNEDIKSPRYIKKNKNGYIDLEPKVEAKLQEMKKTLWKQGTSGEEIRQIIRKERRHAEIRRKRELKKRCFNCRKLGHNLSDCPSASTSMDHSTGLCFKCGSTEHDVSGCTVKTTAFPYAKCFVCGEQGHLSRQCPDNPRGLYPNGGCCKICGSVEHFKKDCPQHQDKGAETFVDRISSDVSADAEVYQKPKTIETKKKKPNIVKF